MVGTYLEITLKKYYFIVAKAPHVISGVTNYVPFQMRNIFCFREIFEVILPLPFRNNRYTIE